MNGLTWKMTGATIAAMGVGAVLAYRVANKQTSVKSALLVLAAGGALYWFVTRK